MLKQAAVMFLALGIAGQAGARERDFLARFDGGIGVIPVAAGVGAAGAPVVADVRVNIVRGVNPGLGPWRIASLKADVDTNGQIKVRGRGLLVASSDGIGTNLNQRVFATLICEAVAPFVERNTDKAGVAIEANGDFRIDDMLNPPPIDCPSPLLLIRNTGGLWFAAGIQKFGEDD